MLRILTASAFVGLFAGSAMAAELTDAMMDQTHTVMATIVADHPLATASAQTETVILASQKSE